MFNAIFKFFTFFILIVGLAFFIPSVHGQNVSPDAIAIRVIPNLEHYSALDWYLSQGFSGSPQSLIVDGYEAVRDGRTVYVNAANVVGGNLYTNIYLISYNKGAEQETIDIFGQILSYWKFNTNINNTGHCSGDINSYCVLDSDCPVGFFCNSLKARIVRDVKRLSDYVTIKNKLDEYYNTHGTYPDLSSGSYLPGKTLSVWPSWQNNLGKILGTVLPQDPINKLGDCGGENYQPETCWDDINKVFATNLPILPNNSLVYSYSVENNYQGYHVCAQTESGLNISQSYFTDPYCAETCLDSDGDGYGSPASLACPFPELDCDDSDKNIIANLPEGEAYGNCHDGIDNDCDVFIDCDDPDCFAATVCTETVCGNNNCEPGESCSTCWQDCGDCPDICNDGICDLSCNECANCPGGGDCTLEQCVPDNSGPIITFVPIFNTYSAGDSITDIQLQITDASGISLINPPIISIQHPDGTDIIVLTLYDDGAHNDAGAGDNIYGIGSWDSTGQTAGIYYIDTWAQDTVGNFTSVDNIGSFTLSSNDTTEPTITLVSPAASWKSWAQGTSDEFDLGDYTLNITENNGEVILTQPFSFANISQISAGVAHTCAVSGSGDVFCWGKNTNYQLGDNTIDEKHTPVSVLAGEAADGDKDGNHLVNIKEVSAGSSHTCAVSNTGNVYCWGNNNVGQLGNNSTEESGVPVRVLAGQATGSDKEGDYLANIKEVSVGAGHTCALANSGNVYCWGQNGSGQLGDNSDDRSYIPVRVLAGEAITSDKIGIYLFNIKKISLGSNHSCVVSNSNYAYCWGSNDDFRLGNDSNINSNVPARVVAGSASSDDKDGNYLANVKEISAGDNHTCAVSNSGYVYCWGNDDFGQLGDGNTDISKATPVRVIIGEVDAGDIGIDGYLANIKTVNVDIGHACAVSNSGNIYCWGYNYNGELGNGDSLTESSYPVRVRVLIDDVISSDRNGGYLANIKESSSGDDHTCAVSNSGNAYCWGYNANGRLGNDSTDEVHTPVKVVSGPSAYSNNGIYTSTIYDTIFSQEFGTISWTENLPANTSLQIKVRTSNDSTMTSAPNWSTCSTVTNNTDISTNNCVNDGDRYMQYQLSLSTTDTSVTPTLDNISIDFLQKPNYSIGSAITDIQLQITDASGISLINPPIISIQHPDGTDIIVLTLYDDGAHNDAGAGDNIYGIGSWDSTGQTAGIYYIDTWAQDIYNNNTQKDNVLLFSLY